MDGGGFDERSDRFTFPQCKFNASGPGDQRKQWKPGMEFHAHERTLRAQGHDAGRQAIAHAAGDGGFAVENHVLAADANEDIASCGIRRNGGEGCLTDFHRGKPFATFVTVPG